MKRRIVFTLLLTPLITGCSTLWHGTQAQTRQGASSSLVDFLYPNGEVPPEVPEKPNLRLPLKVGLAFVPSRGGDGLSAAERQELLTQVAQAFDDRPFVESITPIPEHYLTRAQGLHGMRQVARLFDADVMALVSYDQLSVSTERDSALLYWTVVGALVVKGNSNEVHTMIDTAVFDVPTGKLLFRAPGLSRDQRNASLIDAGREFRRQRVDGFSEANNDMIQNLDTELENLRAAVKSGQGPTVTWRGGGGSLSVLLILTLLNMLQRRSNNAASQLGASTMFKFLPHP